MKKASIKSEDYQKYYRQLILKKIGIKEDRLKASMIVDTADKNITRGINLFFPITCDNSFWLKVLIFFKKLIKS